MVVEKSHALLSSSSFLCDWSPLRSFLGHQSVSLASSVSCVGLTAFLLHRTQWALQPAVQDLTVSAVLSMNLALHRFAPGWFYFTLAAKEALCQGCHRGNLQWGWRGWPKPLHTLFPPLGIPFLSVPLGELLLILQNPSNEGGHTREQKGSLLSLHHCMVFRAMGGSRCYWGLYWSWGK